MHCVYTDGSFHGGEREWPCQFHSFIDTDERAVNAIDIDVRISIAPKIIFANGIENSWLISPIAYYRSRKKSNKHFTLVKKITQYGLNNNCI